jgi:aspartate/methionine/tyrosine aminotransferase
MDGAFVLFGVFGSHQEFSARDPDQLRREIDAHRDAKENIASRLFDYTCAMKLEPFALERFQSIWENQVAWNVAESGVQPLRVSELTDTAALRDELLDQELGYPQTNGTAALRELIAAMYPGATRDHIQVTNGGSEANCVLLMRLVEPGDEIVFLMPNYLQASGLARALGASVRPWWLREAGEGTAARWTPDLDELRALVGPRTRAILLCNPNNPTGARLDAGVLDEVCRIASTVGAWVVADEIYRGAEREADDTPTVWGRYERAIVTSGLSKAYGLPGLRIGWIAGPPALIAELWAVHDYTTIAPGGINDRLARVALAPERRGSLLARTRGIVRANYPLVRRWIERQDGLSHIAPEAGAIVFVKHEHPVRSSDLTDRLREARSVLVVPGDYFGLDGYLRIGFGSDPAYLTSALTHVGEFLASLGMHAR